MKIRRYNESVENWSIDKLKNFCEERIKIKNQEKELNVLMYEFFSMNLDYIKNVPKYKPGHLKFQFEEEHSVDISFYLDKRENIVLVFTWDEGDEYESMSVSDELLNELVEFINDPDTYREAKKYNL